MAKIANLINRTEAKRRILALLEARRPGWPCTQVSSKYLDYLEAKIMALIEYDIQRHGSFGKTFGPGVML